MHDDIDLFKPRIRFSFQQFREQLPSNYKKNLAKNAQDMKHIQNNESFDYIQRYSKQHSIELFPKLIAIKNWTKKLKNNHMNGNADFLRHEIVS